MSECSCVNSPMRLLRGVTRTVTLTIKDASGVALDLSAVELTVEVIRDGSADKYVPTISVEGEAHNLIVFTWPADKQKVGLHTIDVRGDFGATGVSRTNWHGPDGIVIVEWARDTSAREVADLSVEEVSMTGTMETAAAASGGNYYVKPEGGIPASDMTEAVQQSLALADSALQSFTETDPTVPAWAKAENKPTYNYSEIQNTPDLSQFITKSVNDLTNYYLKSETYTQAEVQALIGAINQFHYEIAASTSAVTTPAANVLYLIGPTGSGADKYEEYVYSNSTWVKIGDTSVNLSGYVTTTALNTALADYTTTANLTTLLSGKADAATTLAGYGITDAKIESGVITLGSNTITPLTSHQDISGKADKVTSATSGNFAALDSNGNLTDSGHKHSDYLTSHQDISGKADKVSNATNGHLAGLDGNGNLTDSGKSASDFQPTIDSSHKLPYSLISDTPTIPTVVSMAAADIATAVDTAWNAVMS